MPRLAAAVSLGAYRPPLDATPEVPAQRTSVSLAGDTPALARSTHDEAACAFVTLPNPSAPSRHHRSSIVGPASHCCCSHSSASARPLAAPERRRPTRQPPSRTLADGSLAPPAPPVPDGPLDDDLITDLDRAFLGDGLGIDTTGTFFRIGASQDPRVAWLLADLMRFFPGQPTAGATVQAFEQLTDTHVPPGINWITMTNWLIAWDTPAPPGYVNWKRIPFERVEPAWAPFFDDPDADIDWRLITWGGVRIDDRPLSQVHVPCSRCIPALDDPALTDASGGAWYDDAGLVFGLVVNGEARAYPKHIMEVHEMVNDTLGGRRIGIPYCTLCGSAQAYYTDQVPAGFETIELRTSGLLSQSNKVMFDFHTSSVFDTFRGIALSGPLQDQRYALEMLSVVTSTWGEWKIAHPDTTIVAQDGGIGARYPLNPLFGRDDNGPIFPIGGVDQRLPAQEPILGIETPDGQAVAFPVAEARDALERGANRDAERRPPHDGGRRAQRCPRRWHAHRHPSGLLVRLEPVPPTDRPLVALALEGHPPVKRSR